MKMENWNVQNIPDQSGRVVIVTGASSGIGYETARALAEKNATVIIAVRNLQKGLAAAGRIRSSCEQASIDCMELDLSDLASVRTFAERFTAAYDRLDILVNNAGVMIPPYGQTTDGFELQMGTNHLGHFALTGLLLHRLRSTPGARIVNVSSNAHRMGNIDFSDLHWTSRRYNPTRAYGDSKIANLYFTFELSKRLQAAHIGIVVTAAHPGWAATDLQRHSGLFDFLNRFFAQDAAMGALPTLRAAVDTSDVSGTFYGPSGFMQMRGFPVSVTPNDRAKDDQISARLWDISKTLTGVDIDADLTGKQADASIESLA